MLRPMPKPKPLRIGLPLFVAALAMLAAGCSSSKPSADQNPAGGGPATSTTSPTSPTSPTAPRSFGIHDACDIFTAADAKAILGADPGKGHDGSELGVTLIYCNYEAANHASVGLSIWTGDQTAGLIAKATSQYKAVPLTGATGVYADPTGSFVAEVQGSIGCSVLRTPPPTGDPTASSRKLAAICAQVFTS